MVKFKSFEEFFEMFICVSSKKMKKLSEQVKEKAEYRSAEEIFSMGKEYLKEENYLEAITAFNEVSKRENKKIKELAGMYPPLIFAIKFSPEIPPAGKIDFDDMLVKKVIYCMMESTNMYAEKEIPKEELFSIENTIDKISFGDVMIKDRAEFNRIYTGFKEYCINVFTEGKNE
jgi:hypothetical protein